MGLVGESELSLILIDLIWGCAATYKKVQFKGLCIKYKIMAVQPLNKTKIIKKKTNKIRRFQSDEFKRVKVRNHPSLVRVTPWNLVGSRWLIDAVWSTFLARSQVRYTNVAFAFVQRSWRKQRGVDSAVRRRFRGKVREPRIGSKQDKKTRHMLRSGFKKMLIRNEKDIEMLLMNNRTYAAEIANCISAKTR